MSELYERCKHCGAEEQEHYDGVQCPLGPGIYSSTQEYESQSIEAIAQGK